MKQRRIFFLLYLMLCVSSNARPQGVSGDVKKITPNLLYLFQKNAHRNFTIGTENLYKLICTSDDDFFSACKDVGALHKIRQVNKEYHAFVLQIDDILMLQQLIAHPSVVYADVYHSPKEELELGNFDPSLNRINFIRSKYPLADGTGLTASIKENLFDTLDIDFKGRYVPFPLASATSSGHASIMATIIGGGGNTSPNSLGVSPGANLSSSSFSNVFPDPATLFTQMNISLQNHSYGTAVENFYGAEARAYDQQLNFLTGLMHVFSAGNSGTSTPTTGTYTGIAGAANITGNFKMAKNVTVVGATDSFARVLTAISKGPAYDGRIMPQLTAFAEDGSSGAAAAVSGTALMLQHLHKQLYGLLPASALLRAVLFNSADDVGAAGIDFSSGYGSLNAKKAAENITNGRFFSGTVTQSAIQSFPVSVPAGIQTAKFTLVWNDPANNLLAAKALVNDLDITVVRLSDNFIYRPWVLNPYPHPDSLNQLPKRKRDSINNAEQVTIDTPLPGNYEIRVNGFSIPTGSQLFYIAYQYDSASRFEFTQPVKGDYFSANKPNTIRWQNTIAGSGTLQYSYDNVAWNNIANNVNLSAGYYIWTAPDTAATARLRMVTGIGNVTGDTFVISTPPAVSVGFNCDTDFMIWWNKTKNTGQYRLYRLGAKFMEQFATTADTFAVFTKAAQPALHYAVRPVLLNGIPAQRSLTYNYTTQGVSCYVSSFLGDIAGDQASLVLQLGSVSGVQSIIFEKKTAAGFVTLLQVPVTSSLQYGITEGSLPRGLHVYRVRIVRTNGQVTFSDTVTLYYFGKQPYLVYPNPVQPGGSIHVVASALTTAQFKLYNTQGQPVLTRKTQQFEELIPTSGLSAGIYMYAIIEEGKVVQQGRLVIY